MVTFLIICLSVLLWFYLYERSKNSELRKSMIERELVILNLMQGFKKDYLTLRELQVVARPYPLTFLLSEEELKPFITKWNNLWPNSKQFEDMSQLVENRKKEGVANSKIYDKLDEVPFFQSIFRDTLK